MRSSAYAPLLPKPQDAQTPFELLRDKNLRDQVSELLEVLDDRERKIIFQRFGLDGGNPKTLEVIGKKFGVTRERIRQLQNVALDKLRRALRKKETQQAAPAVAIGAPFPLRPKLHTARPKLPCIWYLSPR
jgi:DNA-directed RNA polymerase sigma subunit (sigma70/sigma32)